MKTAGIQIIVEKSDVKTVKGYPALGCDTGACRSLRLMERLHSPCSVLFHVLCGMVIVKMFEAEEFTMSQLSA